MNMTTSITAHGLVGVLGRGAAARELECLLAVANGATGKEAARSLGITEDSVKKRLFCLSTKLGVTRRAALVAKAFALGLIQFANPASPDPQHQQDQHDGVFVA
ncbi:helix-turn-helix domain-containing protein [Pseudomonas sp. 10B1]|uniref:helix-turn-helix domain-containing protein n=1 Tax=unclassified Pseudomonas TaxID=196821 RepID=UPI002AB46641|nr:MULTISPECIES: helix-turn-helix domain-containing protein [unclassified Pseudomonas]MDY7560181.1 helix-turn-helix domain-containing protein [Pseudomonas sp. AB6]MEA9994293.1 helix-turn-helix domain-containing protein [Pseudomonas sp. AA4]MEB0088530.1 helix-turn-helix domain-containing protein [Pseudomonas sp. RTI1]MEB0126547.1 helix-turn-helix domain-containing protein [Pseudomonas sp. CCC1.2]MEB0154640.1 helix-turn-helix domain-containing protein [Pseudomonas sp. CCC4.3]